jgi:pyruvate, water dikinase
MDKDLSDQLQRNVQSNKIGGVMATVFKKGAFFRNLIFIVTLGFATIFSNAFAADNLRPRSASQNAAVKNALTNDLKKTKQDGGEDLSKRLVVKFSEVRKEDVPIAGGKGANLGELQHAKGISVPPGIAVTTEAFKRHINEGSVIVDKGGVKTTVTLRNYIDQRLAGLNYNDSTALAEAGRDIRAAIEAAIMPGEVAKEIEKDYREMGGMAVAVRSSATAEDMADASFAGQQDTYLNIQGTEDVLNAVKRDWASLFTDRAIFYRHDKNIDHGQASLSAVIQVMVKSKKAGTAFSVHTDTGFGGTNPKDIVVSVDGAWGIGEGVVSGATSPDSFVVKKDKNGKFNIYRKVFGAKLKKVVYRKEAKLKAKEGTELVDTSYTERHTFALTDAEVIEVAKAVEHIHKHYGNRFMDIEWAFDDNGKLWILQARSETIWNQWNEKNPNMVKMEDKTVTDAAADTAKVLVSGTIQFGSASGKVVLIDARKEGVELAKELDRIEQGDVLVTTMTKPDMVPGMKRAGAIVTDEGGPTCHAAIIARELGIPCIVGTSKATRVLKEKMVVTVDANRGKIYDGELQIEEVKKNIDPLNLPVTKTKIGIIVASPFLAMKTSALSLFGSHYGAGLVRKEFVDTTEILVHPLAGLAYDLYNDPNFTDAAAKAEIKKNIIDNEELRTAIEDAINGYPNFREFYKDKLSNTLAIIAAAQKGGQHVIVRTTDFKTNEYENQIGGPLYEPKEKNPMMGYRGINRMLSAAYKEAFELEIEAIKQARERQDNIDVMFPVVRTPVELKKAVELFAQHGLVRGDKGFQIGMMVEVPADIFQAEEFYKYVDFMSIGSNDLTQFTLGLGRDNDKMRNFFDEANPAVKKAIEIVVKTAKKMGVRSGLCGQKPSNTPSYAGFLVEAGIDSISVVPQSYEDVVRVVAAQEKALAGKEFDPNIAGWNIPEKAGNPQMVTATEVAAADIIKNIGIHPQALLKYDTGHIVGPGIYEELKGKTAQEYVAGKVYDAIMAKVRATEGSIVYSTDDLDKVVYESLKYGKAEELFDENPELGFCGLARVVDPDWQKFFAWQLEGIKKAIQDSGRKNIYIKLDLPRILPEVNTALDIIKKADLVPGQDVQVGMEIATPSSVLLLDEFIKTGLNFVTENNDRFLSYTMAIDPGNLNINISQEEKDAALVNPQKVWTTIAEKNNIPMVKVDGGEFISSRVSIENLFLGILDKYVSLRNGQVLSLNQEEMEAILWTLNDLSGDAAVKNIKNIRNVIERLSDDQRDALSKLSQGMVFANHGVDKKVRAILINKEALNAVYESEAVVYKGLSNGFGNFANTLKEVKNAKGALVVSANTVLNNAGTLSALKKIKETGLAFEIIVWTDKADQVDKLAALRIDEVATIQVKQLRDVLGGLNNAGITDDKIVVIKGDEEAYDGVKTGVQVVNVDTANAQAGNVNSMTIVVAKAVTVALKDEKTVVEQYRKMATKYAKDNNVTPQEFDSLQDLTSQISDIPMAKVSDEVAKAQVTYEETISKI